MMENQPAPQPFSTSSGGRIYQIPLEAFPGFWTHAYLVFLGEYRVLIDSGSGFGNSNEHLESGLQAVQQIETDHFEGLSDLTHVFITHGHIDHFGGLSYVRPRSPALLGIHELDWRNLTHFEERLVVVARNLEKFLAEAGISQEKRSGYLDLYQLEKSLFHSLSVNFTYESVGMQVGPFEFLHVPGHCAGHVAIRLDDVLFSGDHVLTEISPHLSPESLTLSTGLDHYLHSLDTLEAWSNRVRLTLGGHRKPVLDLPSRIQEIRQVHKDRLSRIMDFLEESHTIAEVAQHLFGEVHGYNVLLAIEEAGAHVEYLYQRGLLIIENLSELERSNGPTAMYYRCVADGTERVS